MLLFDKSVKVVVINSILPEVSFIMLQTVLKTYHVFDNFTHACYDLFIPPNKLKL